MYSTFVRQVDRSTSEARNLTMTKSTAAYSLEAVVEK